MIIFAAVLAVTERKNPNVSPWEVTESLEGSAQGVLRPCCSPEPRGAVLAAAGIVALGSLKDPDSSGNLPVSQPGCRALSCNGGSKISEG